jgi:adenylate cyclase
VLAHAWHHQLVADTDPQAGLPGHDPEADARWRGVLTGRGTPPPGLVRLKAIFKHLPSDPRCKLCYAPYRAPFGPLVGRLGFGRWDKNPSLCGSCLRVMERNQGGAEIELSLLFADLRDSTGLAARISARAYGRLLNTFYGIAAAAIQAPGGTVDKYLGDGVFALFIPGFAGPDHAARAIDAGRQILREAATSPRLPAEARPLPVGIGVHTGTAYVGVLGKAGELTDFTAIGDAVNITERLSSVAGAGELLISDAALAASGYSRDRLSRREPELKGVTRPVVAWADAVAARTGPQPTT